MRHITGVLCLLAVAVGAANGQIQIYSNDFTSGPVGAEWTGTSGTSTTPGSAQHSADRFLGELGNDTVSLNLHNLHPAHTTVSLSFDLYIIRSWDGNFDTDARGPDYWAIDEGAVPVNPEDWETITTFSNWDPSNPADPRQSFPGAFGGGDFLARTGASENNTLGYQYSGFDMDAVYHIDLTDWAHTGADLTFSFGADHLQELGDESWGIDNVQVWVDVPEPTTASLLVLGIVPFLRRRRKS